MRSGYVYFGQFIDHDITRDLRSLAEAGCDVEQTLNYRAPRLNLDLLYGNDPSGVPCIYDGEGGLKLGPTAPVGDPKSTNDDLFRQADGTALVIDSRSDENLIIAQTHVLFAKFHNRVLALLRGRKDLSAGPVGTTPFEQARRFVTWHYQWIVLKDFLPQFIQTETLRDIEQNGLHLFPRAYTPADSPMALPVEFTVAAFRFGHSMIRDGYLFNMDHRFVDLASLLAVTKQQLPADFVIPWESFFTGPGTRVNRGENIDTFIAQALCDMKPSLPELTLKRGSRVRLPSGEEFAERFGYPPLAPADIPAQPADAAFFQQVGFKGRTPLWYYLLREAAVEAVVEPEPGERQLIQKLGTVGGRIVAEVFYQLLNADYDSVMHAGKQWRPPTFKMDGSDQARCLNSMQEVIRFVQAT